MTDLITLPRATVQQALEALENSSPDQYPEDAGVFYDAKDALRAALEQQKPPPEAQTEAEKIAYCAGWWAAIEQKREQPVQDVPETDCGNMQVEWADIPKEFNDWWDADRLTQTNPFREDSPAYWAWEGWQARAALAQPEQAEPAAIVSSVTEPGQYGVKVRWLGGFPQIAMKLFTHPPRREPLSNEELDRLWREPMSADWEHREFARAIEAAHGIKENTTGAKKCMKR
jgi:hypothetical protein